MLFRWIFKGAKKIWTTESKALQILEFTNSRGRPIITGAVTGNLNH